MEFTRELGAEIRPNLVFLQKKTYKDGATECSGRFYPVSLQAIAICRVMRRLTLNHEELFVLGSGFEVELIGDTIAEEIKKLKESNPWSGVIPF